MKTTKTKSFDAVAESRRWKEAVARRTQGMTREQVLGFFSKERALAAMRKVTGESCIVREEPPKKQP
jgi:hypothetical protein